MGIPIKTLCTDGFEMNYICFGKGERVFVILPGLSLQSVMLSADIIAEAYGEIAEKFTVYVFDRRSDMPDRYSVYDMAEDTAKAFEALGLKNVNLFGASQGGMMAMCIAADHPELVGKLMLGSSSARISPEHYARLSGWIRSAREDDAVTLSLKMSEMIYSEEVFNRYREVFSEAGKALTDEDIKRFIICAEGTKDFDVTEKIGSIKCPVLSLGSADDRVLTGAARELEELFSSNPDFESHIYSGYGHAAYDTAPDFKKRLLGFMNR